MKTQRKRRSCIQKELKLILLRIFFRSKIGCKGLNQWSDHISARNVESLHVCVCVDGPLHRADCPSDKSVPPNQMLLICVCILRAFQLCVPTLPTLTILRTCELPPGPFQHQTRKCKRLILRVCVLCFRFHLVFQMSATAVQSYIERKDIKIGLNCNHRGRIIHLLSPSSTNFFINLLLNHLLIIYFSIQFSIQFWV